MFVLLLAVCVVDLCCTIGLCWKSVFIICWVSPLLCFCQALMSVHH